MIILRSTKGGQTYEDLILHKEVPELVFLQTRKLLRDTHYSRAEQRRIENEREDEIEEKEKQRFSERKSSERNNSFSYNPNLQSMRSDAEKVELLDANSHQNNLKPALKNSSKDYTSSSPAKEGLESNTPYQMMKEQSQKSGSP